MARYVQGQDILVAQVGVVRMTTVRAMLDGRHVVAGHRQRVDSSELHDTKAAALAVARERALKHQQRLLTELATIERILLETK